MVKPSNVFNIIFCKAKFWKNFLENTIVSTR